MTESIEIKPADWTSFETVMGENGGCGGCWCMLWRSTKKQMDGRMGDSNRRAMKGIFDTGHVPGLIAWQENIPVGWIQVDRRGAFTRLETSRILKPVDDTDVWSIACFFIHKKHRKKGFSIRLLNAACDFVGENGGGILEGYPIDTPKKNYPSVYAWTGLLGAFDKVGFDEVARRSATRPIMRKVIAQNKGSQSNE